MIELLTGFVVDYVALSNFRTACKCDHKENTDKKAVEVEAALILFRRSLERHSLRYTTLLGDGNSRTHLAL